MAFAGMPIDQANLNNLKDILSTYNRVTESCFSKCAGNFNYRTLTDDEKGSGLNLNLPYGKVFVTHIMWKSCVDSCAGKFINGNQRIMSTFMEIQTRRQKQMAEDAQKQTEQNSQVTAITSEVPVIATEEQMTTSENSTYENKETELKTNSESSSGT